MYLAVRRIADDNATLLGGLREVSWLQLMMAVDSSVAFITHQVRLWAGGSLPIKT